MNSTSICNLSIPPPSKAIQQLPPLTVLTNYLQEVNNQKSFKFKVKFPIEQVQSGDEALITSHDLDQLKRQFPLVDYQYFFIQKDIFSPSLKSLTEQLLIRESWIPSQIAFLAQDEKIKRLAKKILKCQRLLLKGTLTIDEIKQNAWEKLAVIREKELYPKEKGLKKPTNEEMIPMLDQMASLPVNARHQAFASLIKFKYLEDPFAVFLQYAKKLDKNTYLQNLIIKPLWEFILENFEDKIIFDELPNFMKENQDFFPRLANQNKNPLKLLANNSLSHLKEEENEDDLLQRIRDQPESFNSVPEKLRLNREFVLKAIHKERMVLDFIDPQFRKDEEFMFKAVTDEKGALLPFYGHFFEHFSDCLKDNEQVVQRAMALSTISYAYATEKIRSIEALARLAVAKSAENIQHMSEELQRKRDFVIELIQMNPRAIPFILPHFNEDRIFMLEAAKLDGLCIKEEKDWCKDLEVSLEAVKENPFAYFVLSKHVQENPQIMAIMKSYAIEEMPSPQKKKTRIDLFRNS